MPFHSSLFDVVVYDPPHIPNQGNDRSKDFNIRFGLGARSAKENGYSFAHTYPAFMAEAWKILAEDGILLCKIADYIHNHRYQWAHVNLIRAGQDAGFTACDCIIKIRKGPIIDPKKRKRLHHSRRRHCYWIIFRKSQSLRVIGELVIQLPLPQLQIDFAFALEQIRGLYLQEALSKAVVTLNIAEIDAELAKFVFPATALSNLLVTGYAGS